MIILYFLEEFWHAYFDLFVRPLKILFPRERTFYRPDNVFPYYVKDKKPMGYWLGHILGYLFILGFFLKYIIKVVS